MTDKINLDADFDDGNDIDDDYTPWWLRPITFQQHCSVHEMALGINVGAAGTGRMWVGLLDDDFTADDLGPDLCDDTRDDFGSTCAIERRIFDKMEELRG